MRIAAFIAALAWAGAAAADLYRWVDPDTGSVKFSSYPPPWYGNAAREGRAPKVEVIPTGSRNLPGVPARGGGPAGSQGSPTASPVPESLESQRKAMLQHIPALVSQAGTESGMQALNKHLAGLKDLSDVLDQIDPSGAEARDAELDAVIQKMSVSSTPNTQ